MIFKRMLALSIYHYSVSRSASRSVTTSSPKAAHGTFMILLMKLWCLECNKLMQLDFLEKSHFGVNAQKTPHDRVFWILQINLIH